LEYRAFGYGFWGEGRAAVVVWNYERGAYGLG